MADDANKPSPRGEALRLKILDTALKLFSRQGYFNTSIHDIRREAGVSIGAIYHHFQNKENLAAALYYSLLLLMEKEVESACRNEQGCFNQSKAIISKLFDLTMQTPRMTQFILLAQHREYLPEESPICSSKPFQIMKDVVVKGMENGEIRKMDHWVAATTMFGGALRMMNLQLDGVLSKPLPDYLEDTVENAWRGVKA